MSLSKLLYAERDKRMAAELENDRLYQQVAFDKEQLAALRAQLAAEREVRENAQLSAFYWKEQMQPLVDALKEVAENETIGSYEACNIAAAALAKLGK